MAVRKSKKIGSSINGYDILDSRRKGQDTEYQIKCQKCGTVFWKSRGLFIVKLIMLLLKKI